MQKEIQGTALLGDIGATNARFGLLDSAGAIGRTHVLAVADYPGLAQAAEDYLQEAEPNWTQAVKTAALDVAGPIASDWIAMTNHPWSFSQQAVRQRLRLERLLIVNDFAAVAAAAPHLGMMDLDWIGNGPSPAHHLPQGSIGVLGPGSGLGMGSVVPVGEGRWMALPGEGGHAALPPATPREDLVWQKMQERFGHVSAERALSGPGLVNLYTCLAAIDGKTAADLTPAQVTAAAVAGSDPCCKEALQMFAEILGTVAGDLALILGARGGIYIAGGIVPRLGADFPAQAFRKRFEAKGRLSPYVAGIPSFVMRHAFPAFVGLAALLRGGSILAD
jgi:glucokinase